VSVTLRSPKVGSRKADAISLLVPTAAATNLGREPLNLIVWAKINAGMGQSLPIPGQAGRDARGQSSTNSAVAS
jgi:hypothetical protein